MYVNIKRARFLFLPMILIFNAYLSTLWKKKPLLYRETSVKYNNSNKKNIKSYKKKREQYPSIT